MEIHLLSDTHSHHNAYAMPGGDMLIHAGDCTGSGKLNVTLEFLKWYSKQPYKSLILVPGNHDWAFQTHPVLMLEECNKLGIVLLNDSGITIEGIKIWGSPIQPFFFNWAFNRHRGLDIKKHWDLIPRDAEILITHGPTYGILDKTAAGLNVGCVDLGIAISEIKPKLHVFGHIHESRGHETKNGTLYVNASSLDAKYKLIEGVPYKVIRDHSANYSIQKIG